MDGKECNVSKDGYHRRRLNSKMTKTLVFGQRQLRIEIEEWQAILGDATESRGLGGKWW